MSSQMRMYSTFIVFFFQAEDGIRDSSVTGVQTCALPIYKVDGVNNGAWVFEVEMFRFDTARKEVQFTGPSNLEWSLTLKSLNGPAAPVQAQSQQGSRQGGQGSRTPGPDGQAAPQLARRGPPSGTPAGQPRGPQAGQQPGQQ